MEEITCPRCRGTMAGRAHAEATVWQCGSCRGLFLDRAELGALIEGENDWHAHRSSETAPMPRITAEMTAPPAPRARARSFLDALFNPAG